MVRSVQQQQCCRQDVAVGVSVSTHSDYGPTDIDYCVLWPVLQSVGREEILLQHNMELLLAAHRATSTGQVFSQRVQPRQHLESARFLCSHCFFNRRIKVQQKRISNMIDEERLSRRNRQYVPYQFSRPTINLKIIHQTMRATVRLDQHSTRLFSIYLFAISIENERILDKSKKNRIQPNALPFKPSSYSVFRER